MTRKFASLVAGDTATDAKQAIVHSPYDDEVVGQVDMAGEAQIESALGTAYALHRDRDVWLSVSERITVLEKVAVRMQECFDELVECATSEGGKPFVAVRPGERTVLVRG